MNEELTKTQLDALKQQLLDLKAELTQLLAMNELASDTVELDQSKMGRLTRIDALQQQAMAQANRSSSQKRLKRVLQSLVAMQAGEYGFCDVCGNTIPLARLQVKPESELCVACQQAQE